MKDDDIKKLDSQIELLKNGKNGEKVVEKVTTEIVDPEDENHIINISYVGSEVKETTKEIKDLKNINDKTEEVVDNTNKSEENVLEEKENNNNLNKNINNKSNKSLFIVLWIIIGILLITLIVLLFVFKGNDNKDDNKNKNDNEKVVKELTEEEMIDIIDLYGNKLKVEVSKYYDQNNKLPNFSTINNLVELDNEVVCLTHEIYEDKSIYLDDCMVDYKDVDYTYGKKQEIKQEVIDNNNVKFYVHKESKVATLVEPNDKNNYILYSSNIDSDIYDLTIIEGTNYLVYFDRNGYDYSGIVYNYVLGKKAFHKIDYYKITTIRNNDRESTYLPYVAIYKDNYRGRVYSLITEEAISDEFNDFSGYVIGNMRLNVMKGDKNGLIDLNTGKLIIPVEYDFISGYNGDPFVATKDGKDFAFDEDGNQYLTDLSKDGFEKSSINGKFVLYEKKLYDLTGKEICKFDISGTFTLRGYSSTDNSIIYRFLSGTDEKCMVYNKGKNECTIVNKVECSNQ